MMKKALNDDLVSLSNLDERVVLEELKKRFLQNQIYVSVVLKKKIKLESKYFLSSSRLTLAMS